MITKYVLENNHFRVTFLDFGATIYSFEVKKSHNRNIVLTYKNVEDYQTQEAGYFGMTVGRVAGRISDGQFTLNGETYTLEKNEKNMNTLHGGYGGFSFKTFDVLMHDTNNIIFKYKSSDGECGFPGEVTLTITYALKEDGLFLSYEATSTKDTLLNITNHSYFNLDGDKRNVLDHKLTAKTSGYYVLNEKQINDKFIPVFEKDVLYLKGGRILKDIVLCPEIDREPTYGFDHLLVVEDGSLKFENEDLCLEVLSNYPAFQLYATNFPPRFQLINNEKVMKHHALAIEPVDIVCPLNGKYNEIVMKKESAYKRHIFYKISLKK